MKSWKVIRIYKLSAESKAEALRLIHADGAEDRCFSAEFAVEDRQPGIWSLIWEQITG